MKNSIVRFAVVILAIVASFGKAAAQSTTCEVSGYLFNADGSPAVSTQVNAISVVMDGPSFVLTPIVLTTDAAAFTTFTAPRLSTVWIDSRSLGLSASGDVAILIPDDVSATLDVLAQSAKSPVSGFNLTSGSNPTLALSLENFGINLGVGPTTTVESLNGRSGAVTLTSSDITAALNFTPVDPDSVVGAVNASSALIDDARLPPNVIRGDAENTFSAQQTFSNGLQLQGNLGISGDTVATGPYRYQFPAVSASGAVWASAETTGDAAAGNINMAVTSQPNPFAGRNNIVTSWGYNNDGNGSRVVATEPALTYRFETFYTPAPGVEWMESHLQYESTSGKIIRPFAFQIDRNTDVSSFQIQGNAFSYLGPDGTQYVKFMPGGVYLRNNTPLVSYSNNYPFLQQLNAAGDYFVNLAYLDNLNRIQLGGGAMATDVVVSGTSLFVGNNSGVKLTSSGGAGLALSKANGGGAFLTGKKLASDPAPPGDADWTLYAKDNGAGKTQLCVKFSSGPPQCFATQP